MRFRLRLYWNEKLVLVGECTGVLAYENISRAAALIGGRSSPAFKQWGDWPTLDDIVRSRAGDRYTGGVQDSTGKSSYQLECMEDRSDGVE